MNDKYYDQDWLKEFANDIASFIFKNRPHAMVFLRKNLQDWINQGKASPFPVRDDGYGESIEDKINLPQASVIVTAIHDRYNPRSENIGKYSDEINFNDKGKLSEQSKKALAYNSLLATVPEIISADQKHTIDYCWLMVSDHIQSLKESAERDKQNTIKDNSTKLLTIKAWEPPKSYIGTNIIINDYRVPRTTLQYWSEKDLIEPKKDPQTHENYYPLSWFKKRIHSYKPRK